ncbi:MAG: molybdopterin molybdotransferase MoeA [Peptostreptococcaceae bacterium]
MKTCISLEEALEIINLNIDKKDKEIASILEGVNRIVAKNVYSKINNPPFNKSAMDGYAIKVGNGTKENTRYKIIGKVFAGDTFKNNVNENEAVKIMTGAPIPNGANAVIKKEDVIVENDFIISTKNVYEKDNICFEGEDICKNQLIIKEGKKLNYADIGILASTGIREVLVYKKVQIGLISTGDEVVDIGQTLDYGKIYNSNKYSILARLSELGEKCKYIDHAKDDVIDIKDKIEFLSDKVDLIITTGGASVGDKDLLQEVIESIKGKILFKKITIKPGSAVLVSIYKDTLIISLSGNPNAALTAFELLVKPTLEKLNGVNNNEIKRETAILMDDFNKKSNQRRFLRGKSIIKEEKQYVYITKVKGGNGNLSSNLDSNCLIEIEKGNEKLNKGDKVTIIKL